MPISDATEDDDSENIPMKIHPKKDSFVLGTLASISNSWYDNDTQSKDLDINSSSPETDPERELQKRTIKKRSRSDLEDITPVFPLFQRNHSSSLGLLNPHSNITARLLVDTPVHRIIFSANKNLSLLCQILKYSEELGKVATEKIKELETTESEKK
jgi:hypothetical protein